MGSGKRSSWQQKVASIAFRASPKLRPFVPWAFVSLNAWLTYHMYEATLELAVAVSYRVSKGTLFGVYVSGDTMALDASFLLSAERYTAALFVVSAIILLCFLVIYYRRGMDERILAARAARVTGGQLFLIGLANPLKLLLFGIELSSFYRYIIGWNYLQLASGTLLWLTAERLLIRAKRKRRKAKG